MSQYRPPRREVPHPSAAEPIDGLEAYRILFAPPALGRRQRRPRLVITPEAACDLARLVGYLRPNSPDEIDAALAEGETRRIEGVHPGKLRHWKLKADIGLDVARWEGRPGASAGHESAGHKKSGGAR